jgi:uncharacterized protein
MQYGLSDEVIKKIQQIFTENNVVEKVILFGSRAKGNFKQGSDIDLAIIGNKIGMQEIVALKTALEKINLPIEFDLINFKTIAESALIEHIERVGVAIYQK